MTDDPAPRAGPDDPADAAALAAYARALADGVDATLPPWVVRSVLVRHGELTGRAAPPEVAEAAEAAAEAAAGDVAPRVRALLGRDVDDQPTGPLALLREAVRYPTEVLVEAGVAPVARDESARRLHPGDLYDLAPAAFADIDASLHEPGLTWGAAKAHVVLARRRREGRR